MKTFLLASLLSFSSLSSAQDASALRASAAAFRPARDVESVLERRSAALEALGAVDSAEGARALLRAAVVVENEASAIEAARPGAKGLVADQRPRILDALER